MPQPLLLAVMGETASGKTDLAEALADRLGAQLVNADAFQVYRRLDIGTAKSPRKAEYLLMDLKEPDEPFGLGEWVRLASMALQELFQERRHAVVVGGSGLNIRALFERYQEMAPAPDPELRQTVRRRLEAQGLGALVDQLRSLDPAEADRIDVRNPARVVRALERALSPPARVEFELPPFRRAKLAIRRPVEAIRERIGLRTRQMAENGWLDEVAALKAAGYRPDAPGFRAHGYRELWRVLEGELALDEALESVTGQVRRYAKRQRTWLRAEPGLAKLDAAPDEDLVERAWSRVIALGEGVV